MTIEEVEQKLKEVKTLDTAIKNMQKVLDDAKADSARCKVLINEIEESRRQEKECNYKLKKK